jgi:hypothetical protein
VTVLGLTTYVELHCDSCGNTWTVEACTDLGAFDLVYPDDGTCDCGAEGEPA